jgi:DNA-binding HxlR family transcriptional regulator
MKSYGQYCALARGLDVIGDRWTLLIVRELLAGPRRYSELLEGLPGIATNLLAERMRGLEEHQVVARDANARYHLTTWGQGLTEPLQAIARWAAPLMAAPMADDAFRSSWLALPVAVIFDGIDQRRPRLTIEVRTGETPVTIESRNGQVWVQPGPAMSPDLVLTGPPDGIVGLLMGALDETAVASPGVTVQGDVRLLARLRAPARVRPPSLALIFRAPTRASRKAPPRLRPGCRRAGSSSSCPGS